MNNHIVVTIVHDEEVVDWRDFGDEYECPIYEDDPFFLVEVYTEEYGVVSYGELPQGSEVEDTEYHLVSDLVELSELIPHTMFREILYDISKGNF